MDSRIQKIDEEIKRLQLQKKLIEKDNLAEINLPSEILEFKSKYHGKELLEQYPLDTYGLWEIRGEDPNCDLGGSHSNPHLGYLEGKLEDVIKTAIKMKGWYQWGGGGYITKVEGKLITKV